MGGLFSLLHGIIQVESHQVSRLVLWTRDKILIGIGAQAVIKVYNVIADESRRNGVPFNRRQK